MRFSYTARTAEGEEIHGALDAANRSVAEELLAMRGYVGVVLREQRVIGQLRSFLAAFEHIRGRDTVIFLRQFAVMISAQVPMVPALRSLIRQTAEPRLRSVILDLTRDVESGSRLSDALAAHPRVFGAFAVHLVRAGEASGRLEEVLTYLADQSERDEELRGRIRGAMVYPAFILGGLVVVALIMMVFVVPRLTGVLRETGGTLPFATRALMATSDALVAWWWALGVLLVGTIVAVTVALRSPPIRRVWDRAKLHIPAFGPLARDLAVVRFARAFEVLLRGGVDIVPALGVLQAVVGNAAFSSAVAATIREVEDGNSLTSVFVTSSFVPSMVTQLLAVGEETGRLDEVLTKLSAFYGREVDQRIRNLVTLIEPLIMIVMGLAVGVMVAAIILPMYNLASGF